MLVESRTKAKEFRLKKQYNLAEPIYQQLWESCNDSWDKWLGWEYADTLKKLGKIDAAITICKEIYHKEKDFKYNNDLLCWTLFEKYIKKVKKDASIQEINKAKRVGEFIVSTINQDGKKTAYESTVFKIIDLLKNQKNINDKELLKWISKLKYDILSDEVIEYNLPDGLSKEGASRKEQFFSVKTKTLIKLGEYEQCLQCCNEAMSILTKFHYSNDIWFEVRRNFCIAMINDGDTFENAVQTILKLADRKKHWTIYGQAFECYVKNGDYKNALLVGAKALITKDPIEMKVSLLYDYGLALEKVGDIQNAIEHYYYSYITRASAEWHIPESLKEKVDLYRINELLHKDISELRRLWLDYSQRGENILSGKILRIMPHGKSGFITTETNENYFFKKTSIVSGYHCFSEGKPVRFRLVNSFDPKKQIESQEAIDIIICS
jgi:tetratricopeptide (TPR) repeat protein